MACQRATNDVDLVIAPAPEQLDLFINALGKDYYVNPQAAQNALKENAMFNIIDNQTGWKADMIIRKERPFSLEEFQRKRPVEMMGLQVWILSPEDVILSKLEWCKGSESAQQFKDALGVAVVQGDSLDRNYLRKWAEQLQIKDLLGQLLTEAEKMR